MTRHTTFRRRSADPARRGARAYTLTELLFAIFILGIGLSMSAALFPTAMRENEMSFNDVTGTIICNNGLAIAQAFLRAEDLKDSKYDGLAILADESYEEKLSARAQHDLYGQEDPNSPGPVRGFVLLGKRLSKLSDEPKENRCLLVAVAYSRRDEGRQVTVRQLSGKAWLERIEHSDRPTEHVPRFQVDDADPNDVPIGSPVIVEKQVDGVDTVVFAKIVSRDGNDFRKLTLDRDLSGGAKIGEEIDLTAFVVVDGDELVSPAMATVVSVTALQRRAP